jgi:membrane-associated phospholipid phosphatase
MNRILNISAKALSIILYPLFIPTYGTALFCYALSRSIPVPTVWLLVAIIGTFILTSVLPITAIWILIRQGVVSDLQIADSGERTMPYIYTLFGFAFWSYLMISILHAPLFIDFITIGATIAIGLIAIINRRWKISAHLTGLGGLTGGVLCYYMGVSSMPSWGLVAFLFVLSAILMYARVGLHAHTPAQVSAGWLLGIACIFLPYCIYQYAA